MSERLIPPFVYIQGHPYLVMNWDLDDPPGIEHYLVIRPLYPEEFATLRTYARESEYEAWAVICWNRQGKVPTHT